MRRAEEMAEDEGQFEMPLFDEATGMLRMARNHLGIVPHCAPSTQNGPIYLAEWKSPGSGIWSPFVGLSLPFVDLSLR